MDEQMEKKAWFITLKSAKTSDTGTRVELAFDAQKAFYAARKSFEDSHPAKAPWIVTDMKPI